MQEFGSRVLLGVAFVAFVAFVAACSDTAADPPDTARDASVDAATANACERDFAPVPDRAKGPAIDPMKGYFVGRVGDAANAYWVTDGAYIALFFTTGAGVILVDAPPTLGTRFADAISEVTDEPVTHVVYSHHHGDHIGAAGQFSGATFIAHEEAAARIARANDPTHRPMPTITFSDSYTLEVGTQTLELRYDGLNHEPGNIYIYAPDQEILMLVDIVYPKWVPFSHFGLAKDIPGYLEAHDKALAYDFTYFIGGHVNQIGTRDDVEESKRYFLSVQSAAASALGSVDFYEIAERIGFENTWLLTETYLGEVSARCAEELEGEWLAELGGTDVLAKGHCFTMAESLRLD
jgi:glyoxylase-like metal-dependent hydrolase (beta-lactamase superfamily II)